MIRKYKIRKNQGNCKINIKFKIKSKEKKRLVNAKIKLKNKILLYK